MINSLAILGRGHFFPTPSAVIGSTAGCPFCIARQRPTLAVGEKAILLSGWQAGKWIRLNLSNMGAGVDVFDCLDSNERYYLSLDSSLVLPHRLISTPIFLPKLSIDLVFVLDELSTWFCNRGLAGGQQHCDDDGIIELARTCWEKRIPVTTEEMVRMLLAHGLPTSLQDRAHERFDFAISTLVAARGRSAIAKLRKKTATQDQLMAFRASGA